MPSTRFRSRRGRARPGFMRRAPGPDARGRSDGGRSRRAVEPRRPGPGQPDRERSGAHQGGGRLAHGHGRSRRSVDGRRRERSLCGLSAQGRDLQHRRERAVPARRVRAIRRAAQKIFVCRPRTPAEEQPCAREIVTRLATARFSHAAGRGQARTCLASCASTMPAVRRAGSKRESSTRSLTS